MSDDNKPKTPPVEGKTQAFRLKIDGWMTDLMKQDFNLEESPPAEAPPEGEPAANAGEAPDGAPPRVG